MLREASQWGVSLTALSPVPDGFATELRLSGGAELTIPLL